MRRRNEETQLVTWKWCALQHVPAALNVGQQANGTGGLLPLGLGGREMNQLVPLIFLLIPLSATGQLPQGSGELERQWSAGLRLPRTKQFSGCMFVQSRRIRRREQSRWHAPSARPSSGATRAQGATRSLLIAFATFTDSTEVPIRLITAPS